MPGTKNSFQPEDYWGDTRRNQEAKHGEHDNGQNITGVEFYQLGQHTLGSFDRGIYTTVICAGVIKMSVDEPVCMRFLPTVRIAL